MKGLASRLTSGPLAIVLAAWLFVCTGGWAFTVVLSVYAFDRSGAGAVGAVAAARLLPGVLVAPLTGGLVDRIDRARVVVGACLLQAALFGVGAGLVLSRASIVPIVALAATGSFAATAARPALEALMPALARTPDELTRATAGWSAIDNGGFLLGGGAGGVLIAALGAGQVAAISAGLVALAGLLALRLPSVMATALDEPDEEEDEGFKGALAGLRAVARSPMLRSPYALFAGVLLLEGTTDVQLVVLAIGKLRMGNGGPGTLYAVWGAGGVAGSAVVLWLVRRRGYGLALAVGSGAFAAGLALAGVDGIAVAIAAMVPAGLGFALVETGVMAIVPRLADDAIVGRVYALSEILYAGAGGVGAVIAPALIVAFGVADSLIVVGAVFGAAALLALRTLSRLDTGQLEAGRLRELLRGVSFLAELPLPRLERLVRGARELTVPAGATVVARGEQGEDFFVIADGTAEIVEYGRNQGPGTGFGEIALLHDVPRTATVRAVTDLRLWALTRKAFIAAVTAHGEATRLVSAIIAEHLSHPSVIEPVGDAEEGTARVP